MITKEDLLKIKEKILEAKKPLKTFIQVKHYDGKIEKIDVVIIINPKAKIKHIKQAVPITIKEIWEQVKDKNSLEEQQEAIGQFIIKAKEFYTSAEKAKDIFEGKYLDIG